MIFHTQCVVTVHQFTDKLSINWNKHTNIEISQSFLSEKRQRTDQ